MKDQHDLTVLLKQAKSALGIAQIKSLLPSPFTLMISDHDTGCQIRIQLAEEGHPTLTAWEGSIWYSSSYLFNDRDKVLGLNPRLEFCSPSLEQFFERVENQYVNYQANQIANQQERKQQTEQTIQAGIEHYKAKF
jgi:hypothetical protein